MTLHDVVQCPVDFYSDRGPIRVHDGITAGSLYYLIEFLDGDLVGKKL
jgi:hypothetical protein